MIPETHTEWLQHGGCIRQMAVLRSLRPLSPTIDVAFGADSTVGERAGVRGLERAVWPPHPQPSPPQNAPSESDAARGGEGAGGVPPMSECTPTRAPDGPDLTTPPIY